MCQPPLPLLASADASSDHVSPFLYPVGLQLLAVCLARPDLRPQWQLQVWAAPCPVHEAGAEWQLLPEGCADLPGFNCRPFVHASQYQVSPQWGPVQGIREPGKLLAGRCGPADPAAASLPILVGLGSPAQPVHPGMKLFSNSISGVATLQDSTWLMLVQPDARDIAKCSSSEGSPAAAGSDGQPGVLRGAQAAAAQAPLLLEFDLVNSFWVGGPAACRIASSELVSPPGHLRPPTNSSDLREPLGPAFFEDQARQLQSHPETAAAAAAARAAAAALSAAELHAAAAERPQRLDGGRLALFATESGWQGIVGRDCWHGFEMALA